MQLFQCPPIHAHRLCLLPLPIRSLPLRIRPILPRASHSSASLPVMLRYITALCPLFPTRFFRSRLPSRRALSSPHTRQQSRLASLLQSVTLAPDVERRRVVQQPVQDRRGDDRVAEDRAPLPVALVARQDDAPPLIAGRDQL